MVKTPYSMTSDGIGETPTRLARLLASGGGVRRDNQVALIASSPGELRDLVVADYDRRPVPAVRGGR